MKQLKNFWDTIETVRNFSLVGIPVGKIVAIIAIAFCTRIAVNYVLKYAMLSIDKVTNGFLDRLDDQLLKVLKSCISWLLYIAGFWLTKQILAEELGSGLIEVLGNMINLLVVLIIAYVVYRGSEFLGKILAGIVLQTDTELDDILKPLMPKIFQSASVVILTIKVSELFLGQSAGALVGLLGGAGLTLGLLIKDVIYEWFCTLVVYSDKLYREGDIVLINGLDGFCRISVIGFRSTTIHVEKWASIVKMPNSKMIAGIVENWSQNCGEDTQKGVNLTLKIDDISASKVREICRELEKIPTKVRNLSTDINVRFTRIEGNSRIIEISGFAIDDSTYIQVEKEMNLSVLEVLELTGIETLVSEAIVLYPPTPSHQNN